MKRGLVGLAFLMLSSGAAQRAGAEAITLTFEGYGTWTPPAGSSCPSGGCYSSNPWVFGSVADGLLVSGDGLLEQHSDWGGHYNFYPSNGTGVLYVHNYALSQVSFAVGPASEFREFSLMAVDLAAPPWYGLGASEVRMTGYLGGRQVRSMTVSVSDAGYLSVSNPFDGAIDTVILAGLSSHPDAGHFVLDNLQVHVVPEPLSGLLLAWGVGMAAIFARRQSPGRASRRLP